MAKIIMLPRLRNALLSMRHLIKETTCLNGEGFACKSSQCPFKYDARRGYHQTVVKSNAKMIWKGLRFVNINIFLRSKLDKVGQASNKLPSQDVTRKFCTVPSCKLSTINNQHLRPYILTSSNRSLVPLSFNYRRLHLALTCHSPVPEELPYYEPPEDELGLTYSSDLSGEDQDKLKYLAKKELKSFLDSKKIKYKKGSSKTHKDKGVFGTPLDVLAEKDIASGRMSYIYKTPTVYRTLMEHTYNNGKDTKLIFKEPGDPNKVKALRKLMADSFYTNPIFNIRGDHYTVHDTAELLKIFLEELPVPLICSEYFDKFPDITNLSFEEEMLKSINLFLLSMNQANRDTLQNLTVNVNNIARNKDKTEMNDFALSEVFGPIIFQKKTTKNSSKAQLYTELTRVMIFYNNDLFVVPPALLKKLRAESETAATKSKNKVSSKQDAGENQSIYPQLASIDVHATYLEKKFDTVAIDNLTTAADVVAIYCGGKILPPVLTPEVKEHLISRGMLEDVQGRNYLFEAGGNLSERCLDPKTKMLAVYSANPKAHYVIKPRRGRPRVSS